MKKKDEKIEQLGIVFVTKSFSGREVRVISNRQLW